MGRMRTGQDRQTFDKALAAGHRRGCCRAQDVLPEAGPDHIGLYPASGRPVCRRAPARFSTRQRDHRRGAGARGRWWADVSG